MVYKFGGNEVDQLNQLISLVLPSMPEREIIGNDWKDPWMKDDETGKECFQSLFFHWCQTC